MFDVDPSHRTHSFPATATLGCDSGKTSAFQATDLSCVKQSVAQEGGGGGAQHWQLLPGPDCMDGGGLGVRLELVKDSGAQPTLLHPWLSTASFCLNSCVRAKSHG